MYGAVHEAGRDTQAKVARRPRNWIPHKVDARIPVYVPDERRPHIPRSCHRDSGLRLSGCLMSVDSVSQATRCALAETVWGAGSAKCCHRFVSRHGGRRGAGPCTSPAGSRGGPARSVRLAGISFCLLRHVVVDGQRESRGELSFETECGGREHVLALTF
jgi:hypothetical protein